MKKIDYKFFNRAMLLTLVVIGVLQSFELSKMLDYTLLILAVLFGSIGYYIKFIKS